jgi:hypothetical protein
MVQTSITDTQFGYRDLEEYEVAGEMFAKIFALHITIDIIRNFAPRMRREKSAYQITFSTQYRILLFVSSSSQDKQQFFSNTMQN